MDQELFSFQGEIFLAERNGNGDPKVFRSVGDARTFDLSLTVTKEQSQESRTGRRLLAGEIVTAQNAALSMVLNHYLVANVALGLYGKSSTIAGGSVTDESLPNPVAQGDYVGLKQQNISTLVTNDSNATPATLVEGTDYEINSAAHGSLKFIGDLSGYTLPLLADYDYAGGININMFTQPPPIRSVRLEGINTADGDKPVLVELYKVQFDPVETKSLINPAYGNLPINGSVQYDSTKAADDLLGQFGRIIDLSQTGA